MLLLAGSLNSFLQVLIRIFLSGTDSMKIMSGRLSQPPCHSCHCLAWLVHYKCWRGWVCGMPIVYARLLPSIMLSGRMERVHFHGQEWIFDVAHNPAGAHFLANRLQQAGITPVTVIFSAMSDKDLVGIFTALSSVVRRWIFFPAGGQCARGFSDSVASSCNAGRRRSDVDCLLCG
jgi:hypothetical protein